MIQSLRGLAADHVEVVSRSEARAEGVSGMSFAPLHQRAASERPGPAVHRKIAAALADRLRPFPYAERAPHCGARRRALACP
jgi:hypothetical protein